MNRHGFTLIEILTVIVVIGALLAIATLQFSDYIRKGSVEGQTKGLYSDLMMTRTAAATQGSSKRVIITPTTFTFVSSALGGQPTSNRTIKTLSRTVTWSGKSAGDKEIDITFNERGMLNIDPDNNTTVCVEPSVESAQYDSIVIYTTRIHLGKVAFEGECKSANVTVN